MAYKRFSNNFGKFFIDNVGSYDIPRLNPFILNDLPINWIGFNEVKSFKGDKSLTGVHFFIDYQFERVWNFPDRYVSMLSGFKVVLSPDFSLYEDMPFSMQLWNLYRGLFVACFWQSQGVSVVPSLTWSSRLVLTDVYPVCSTVAVSSVGVRDVLGFRDKYNLFMRKILPTNVLFFGNVPGDISGVYNVNLQDLRFNK